MGFAGPPFIGTSLTTALALFGLCLIADPDPATLSEVTATPSAMEVLVERGVKNFCALAVADLNSVLSEVAAPDCVTDPDIDSSLTPALGLFGLCSIADPDPAPLSEVTVTPSAVVCGLDLVVLSGRNRGFDPEPVDWPFRNLGRKGDAD